MVRFFPSLALSHFLSLNNSTLMRHRLSISSAPQKHAGLKMQAEQRRLASKNDQMGEDHDKLLQQVAQQEGIIDMLKMQIAQLAQVHRAFHTKNV